MADIKMSEFKEVDKVDKLLGLDDSGNGCCIRMMYYWITFSK